MEQKKSERARRGAKAWQPKAHQQELDEEDRFQVRRLLSLTCGRDQLSKTK